MPDNSLAALGLSLGSLSFYEPEDDPGELSDASTIKVYGPSTDQKDEDDGDGARYALEENPTIELRGTSLVRTAWPEPGMTDTAYRHQMTKNRRDKYRVDCSVAGCRSNRPDKSNGFTRLWLAPRGGAGKVVYYSTDLCDAHYQQSLDRGTLDTATFDVVPELGDAIEQPRIVEGSHATWAKIGPMGEEDGCQTAGYQWTTTPSLAHVQQPGVSSKGTINLCFDHAKSVVSGTRLTLKTPLETLYRRARKEYKRTRRADFEYECTGTETDNGPIATFLDNICPTPSDMGACTRRKSSNAPGCDRCSAFLLHPEKCSSEDCSRPSQSPISSCCEFEEQGLSEESECVSCHQMPEIKWERIPGHNQKVNTTIMPNVFSATYCEPCFKRDVLWIDQDNWPDLYNSMLQRTEHEMGWWMWSEISGRQQRLTQWAEKMTENAARPEREKRQLEVIEEE